MAGDFLRALSGQTPSQVDMGGPVGWGLRGMSMVPGPVGWLGTLGSMGVRGNNMGFTNAARHSWGQDGLSFGQSLGGVFGLNSYGRGGAGDKLGEFRGTDVTPSGMSSRGGFLGIGAEPVGAYTPGEAQKRQAASVYGNAFGTPQQAPAPVQQAQAPQQAAPGPVQSAVSAPATPSPAKAVPQTARRVYSKDQFDMGAYNADPDPIGAAIRGMGASLSGGGRGRGQGGTGGDRSGGGAGGRSDRSTNSSGRG